MALADKLQVMVVDDTSVSREFQLNNFVTKPFTTASLKSAIEAVVGRLS